MSDPSYSKTRIFLHWLSAIVILWASFTGFLASCYAPSSPIRTFFDVINPQITTLFIPFFAWRLGLYVRSTPFASFHTLSGQERLATLTHLGLYMLITAVLLTGVLMMPTRWTLLGILPMPVLGMLHNDLFLIHKFVCIGLAVGICLHLLAVLYHLQRGHKILRRMRFSQAGTLNR